MDVATSLPQPKAGDLFLRGVLVVVAGVLGSMWLFPQHATLVALFLATIGAEVPLSRILEWNRQAIYQERMAPLRANLILSSSLLALLLGASVAFTAFACALPWESVGELFAEQLGRRQYFPVMHFGQFRPLFFHNLGVVVLFFVIALPFRHGGVMLAVAWNASVWGATVGTLARQWSEGSGPALPLALPAVSAAILPHLALEGFAYVTAGLAGVFASRAAMRHRWSSPVMLEVLQSVLRLLAIAATLTAMGAAWEAHVARMLVRWLS